MKGGLLIEEAKIFANEAFVGLTAFSPCKGIPLYDPTCTTRRIDMEISIPGFNTNQVLQAIVLRRNFFQVEAMVRQDEDSVVVTICKNSVLATTGAERKALETARTGRYRWSQGGLGKFYKFRDRTIFLAGFRDNKAPSYPLHSTIASGLAGSVEELVRVDELAFREGAEEDGLWIRGEGMVLPLLEEDEKLAKVMALGAITSLLNVPKIQNLPSFFSQETTARKAKILQPKGGQKKVQVGYEEAEDSTSFEATVVFDAGTNGLDLLWFVEVDVSDMEFDSPDWAFLDGETLPNGTPLNRRMDCYEIVGGKFTRQIIASFQSGKHVESAPGAFPHPLTPVMKASVEAFM